MVKRVLLALALAAVALSAPQPSSVQLTLGWDAPPVGEAWVEVRVYDSGAKVATLNCTAGVPCTQVSFTTTKGVHSFTARSFNGDWESEDSNVVVTKTVPKPPGNVRR